MKRKILSAVIVFTIVLSLVPTVFPSFAAEAETEQTIVTEYSDLWEADISVQVGKTVKWYVNVPEGTNPKGCRATIKIPGLGWGTDSHNKEEGHLTLAEGNNFVYEFTPDKTGDILFTCWMGSGCHSNYIHVTEGDEAAADIGEAAPGTDETTPDTDETAPDTDENAPGTDENAPADVETPPQTGDIDNIIILFIVQSASVIVLFVMLTRVRKKHVN